MPHSTLLREIEQDHFGGVLRYRFPRRNLGRIQWIGLAMIVLSLLMMIVPTATMGWSMMSAPGAFRPVLVAFWAFWCLGLVSPMIIGVMIWKGHTQITLDGERLISAERCGPLRWRRKVRIDRIKALVALYSPDGKLHINGKPSERLPEVGRSAALSVRLENGKPGFVLIGYPTEWTLAIGEELAERLRVTLEHSHEKGE